MVVLRVAGVEDPVPIETARKAAHGRLLLRDVVVGPPHRILTAPDGRVLGGQSESIPADGVHDVEAPLHPVPSDDITQRVRLGVAHMQVTGGVREHVEHVLLGTLIIWASRSKRRQLVPHREPPFLDGFDVVPGVVVAGVRTCCHSRARLPR